LSEDPNFIAAGAPDWVTGMPADSTYTGLKGFVNTQSVNYLASPQNLNSYSYINENPLRYKDPTGKDLIDPFVFGLVAANSEAAFNHVENTVGVSTDLSDRDAYVLGYGGGFGYGLCNCTAGASAGVFAASFLNDFRNGRKFNLQDAANNAGSVYALGSFFDYAPTPISVFPASFGPTLDRFTQFYQGEFVNSLAQWGGQNLQNTVNARNSNGGSAGSTGTNINQLGQAVVSYANSSGADYTSPSFIAAIRTINLYNSPWLASQSTSISTPSVISKH
jgi:hypothetical protein